jgi:hypothetical protein
MKNEFLALFRTPATSGRGKDVPHNPWVGSDRPRRGGVSSRSAEKSS